MVPSCGMVVCSEASPRHGFRPCLRHHVVKLVHRCQPYCSKCHFWLHLRVYAQAITLFASMLQLAVSQAQATLRCSRSLLVKAQQQWWGDCTVCKQSTWQQGSCCHVLTARCGVQTRRDGSTMTLAQSKRASDLQTDINAWEENRLFRSGVVRLKEVGVVPGRCRSHASYKFHLRAYPACTPLCLSASCGDPGSCALQSLRATLKTKAQQAPIPRMPRLGS